MAHYGGGGGEPFFYLTFRGGEEIFVTNAEGGKEITTARGGEEIFGRVKNSLRCMSRKDLICLTSLIRRHGTNFLGIKIDTVVLRGITFILNKVHL